MSFILHHKSAFPIFKNNPTLVYLDSAATTHKPRSVIKAETDFYSKYNANVHRGIYGIAVHASTAYENVREKTAAFIGAADKKEIIFTGGTTAGINLVAQSFLAPQLQAGDEVIISAMEHHANLIPWQQVCLQKKSPVAHHSRQRKRYFGFRNLRKTAQRKNKIRCRYAHIQHTRYR